MSKVGTIDEGGEPSSAGVEEAVNEISEEEGYGGSEKSVSGEAVAGEGTGAGRPAPSAGEGNGGGGSTVSEGTDDEDGRSAQDARGSFQKRPGEIARKPFLEPFVGEEDSAAGSCGGALSLGYCNNKKEYTYTDRCRQYYIRMCKLIGVVPVRSYVRCIFDVSINLSHYGLGPDGTKALSVSLQGNTSTTALNIEDNDISGRGAECIAALLSENDCISFISLGLNNLQSRGAKALCKMLEKNSTLHFLDVSNNGFIDRDAQYFCDALCKNIYLKNLIISHNDFGEKAAQSFGSALILEDVKRAVMLADAQQQVVQILSVENDSLEELDLSWNNFRSHMIKPLCIGIKKNVSLVKLNLSHNGLADEGATIFAHQVIKGNNTLLNIDISNNRISHTGAAALAKNMSVNETLQVFNIAYNSICANGAHALLKGIASPQNKVEELDMMGVDVNTEFMNFKRTLCENRKITIIHGRVHGDQSIHGEPVKTDPLT